VLETTLRDELLDRYQQMINEEELLTREQLSRYYRTFQERFGPEQLRNLDGEALLETMHGHGNQDSLVYWLEFKNDEEFPSRHFGSIAGGSALKFGIYRSKKSGTWMTGSPSNQKELSVEEAIEIARNNKRELLRGSELIEQLPAGGGDGDYARLQQSLDSEAPKVSRLAWGHKYFSLLFPDKLDDYHAEQHQRFHLIKLLQLPPEGDGRYLCAGRYVAIADELGMPINHLTALLNRRDGGSPHRYWRVLVNFQDEGWRDRWEALRDGSYVSIGWKDIGDLSDVTYTKDGRDRVRSLMLEAYRDKGGWAREVFDFVAAMQPGDVVLAFERTEVLGIGRITGEYRYAEGEEAPHWRAVEWLNDERWELPRQEAKGRSIRPLENLENLKAIEERLLGATPTERPYPGKSTGRVAVTFDGIPGRIQRILERKGQLILYGPPGTGKTYWARKTLHDLASVSAFGTLFRELTDEQARTITGSDSTGGVVRVCTFHPAYGYEDFIEGFRPQQNESGALAFERRAGLFKSLCSAAEADPKQKFYLLIDEINRGDIPRIFGELLTLLELDKRGQSVALPLSGERFSVPSNLYVVGTMNTADRSIALLDTALRRRFGFVELLPDYSVLGTAAVVGTDLPLGPWLSELNSRILEHVGRDARNLQIGHAYLLRNGKPVTAFTEFLEVLREDIVPLLQEYCYEDYRALSRILGSPLVDEKQQRIHWELFSSAHLDDLIQALLAPAPEIAATPVEDHAPEQDDELEDDAPEDETTTAGESEGLS